MGFPQRQAHSRLPVSNDVTVALTGQSITSAIGTFAVAASLALSGIQGTADLGTVTPSSDVPVTGSAIASSQGTLTPNFDLAVSGMETDFSQGSFSAGSAYIDRPRVVVGPFPFPKAAPAFPVNAATIQLTGQDITSAAGSMSVAVDVPMQGSSTPVTQGDIQAQTPGSAALEGLEADLQQSSLSPNIVVALTGQQIDSSQGQFGASSSFVERPHSISGPFPFLTGGLLQFKAKAARPVQPQSQSVTVQLTGQAIVSALGTVTPAASIPVAGSAIASAQGVVAPAISPALSGSQINASQGSMGLAAALSGSAATAQQGSVGVDVSVPLVGSQISSSQGALGAQSNQNVSIQLTGQAISASAGTLSPANTEALSGSAATLSPGTLGVDRSVALTGLETDSALGPLSAAGGGSVSLSGIETILSQGTLTPGVAVTLQGQVATAVAGDLGHQADFPLNPPGITIQLTGMSMTMSLGNLELEKQATVPFVGTQDLTIGLRGSLG